MSYPPPPPSLPPPPPPPPYAPPSQPSQPPQPPQQRRRRALPIAVVVALLLVAAAVVVPLAALRGADDEESPASAPSTADVDTGTLALVEEYDDLDPTHVEGDVDYDQSPPVGGHHDRAWLECGAYDEPVREENVVHDLEHGTVWITYRADLVDDAAIAALEDQLPGNGILSPYPDQSAPVVITVWGRQLELLGPDDPRIALFIAEYGAGETAPEPFASCAGGLTDPRGSGAGTDV